MTIKNGVANFNSDEIKLVSNRKPITVSAVYLVGIISWILTLIGFYQFFNINPWYWLFSVPIGVFTLYTIPNYFTNFFYKKPDLDSIIRIAKNQKVWPPVDIFLPVCGESKETLSRTWDAVRNLNYPEFNVVVGDDMGLDWVREMAQEYGFTYLSRPDKGFMKKTGNLKYLFEHTQSKYFVVFDADFCPKPEFLALTIPQISQDSSIGILQVPQTFFEGKNSFEDAASNTQIDFYKTIQNSRDFFHGTICVGSNAVFRREAIEQTQVYDWLVKNKIDHGEDVNTGFYLLNEGYLTKYFPLELAFGNSADSVPSFIKQRNRWSSSSTRMFLSGIVGKSNLTLMQKICFYTGFLYYISDPFKFLLNYMLFVVIYFHGSELNLINSLWFWPHILFGFIVLPIFRGKWPTFASKAADLILVYTHTYTVWHRLLGKGATWVPTGKVTNTDNVVKSVKTMAYVNFSIYATITLILTYLNKIPYTNIQAYTVIFWILYFILMHIITFYYFSKKSIN